MEKIWGTNVIWNGNLTKQTKYNILLYMRMNRIRNDGETAESYILTPQRRIILEVIRKSCGHLDAKELYRLVSKRDPTISLATVYRSLSLFKQLGTIDEHRLGKTRCCYEIKQSMEHQHFMCRCCGKVVEFESPLISIMIEKLQDEKDFVIEKVELCIQGTCFECRQKNAGNTPT
jgi:Fe2+ or Zn2+ uptake regulation protein